MIHLVSQPNYRTTTFFSEDLLAIEMKRTRILMNKPVCLGLSILEISKIVMHKFWYDCVKPKYEGKANLCYMDTDRFLVYINSEDIYLDIAKGGETRFHTSNYLKFQRPLPKG